MSEPAPAVSWVRKVLSDLGILLAVLLPLLAWRWTPAFLDEMRCLEQLRVLDGRLNGAASVEGAREQGRLTEDGHWKDPADVWRDTGEALLRCPVSGKPYTVEFQAGRHPVCPVHGPLIARYQCRPQAPPSLRLFFTQLGMAVLVCSAVLVPALVVFALVRHAVRRYWD